MTVDKAPQTSLARRQFALPGWFGLWEVALLGLVAIAMIVGSVVSTHFFTSQNFAITAAGATGLALMVVPMTWLMIAGEIDLSVASVFGLAGVVFGLGIETGFGLPVAFVLALATGAAGGLVNAYFAVVLGLPSLIVTVGTLSVYRGLAYVLLESRAISSFPQSFVDFTQGNVAGSDLPNTFAVFLVIAVISGILLQRGALGRKTYAIGSSPEVSRLSGIRVKHIKVALFVVSGLVAALAGVMFSGYVNSGRANNGTGLELSVIAVVLIGGVSMFGGEGKFLGVMLSLVLITTLSSVMTLKFIGTDIQYMVIGLLMSGAVVVPGVARGVIGRVRRGQPQLR